MADDVTTLELLQGFHQVLLAVRERRIPAPDAFENGFLVEAFESELERLWTKPPKSQASRTSLQKGTDDPHDPRPMRPLAKRLQAKLPSMAGHMTPTNHSSKSCLHSPTRSI